MKAQDVMKSPVIAVNEDTPVSRLVELLLERHVSGVPVVNDAGKVVGMVSEGDLLRRPELGTDHKPSRWLSYFTGSSTPADFMKTHGATAGEIMCTPVVSVTPEQDLKDVVTLMESKGVKRVPVIVDDVPVGIIARADLLLALSRAGVKPQPKPASDREVRAEIQRRMDAEDWSRSLLVNVVVHDGKASIWGVIDNDDEHRAVRRLVEEVPGVVEVEDCSRGHLYYT